MDILINDESVASDYGFRILNAGLDLTRYKANNQVLYMHNDKMLAIGNIENIRVDGSQLLGTVKWDDEDEDGDTKRIIKKYKSGVMKGWSVGILPIEFKNLSADNSDGGDDVVAMKSELYEISPVTLQSNRASVTVKLMNEKELIRLGHINDGKFELKIVKNSDMKKILLALGMDENCTEDMVVERINKMSNETKSLHTNLVNDLVKQAVAKGLATEATKEGFAQLATANYIAAKSLVDGFVTQASAATPKAEPTTEPTATTNLTDFIKRLNSAHTEGSSTKESDADKYLRLGSEGGLDALEAANPTEFKRLESAYASRLDATKRRR
jgi:HK97 family phage prohead protease